MLQPDGWNVVDRFIARLVEELPHGAGERVWHVTCELRDAGVGASADCRRFYRLLDRAQGWSARALDAAGHGDVADGLRSLGGVHDRDCAAYNAAVLNGYRRRLEGRAGTQDVREVLLQTELALRVAAAHDEEAIPRQQLDLGLMRCAKALTAAFAAGYVDAVPTVARATADELARVA